MAFLRFSEIGWLVNSQIVNPMKRANHKNIRVSWVTYVMPDGSDVKSEDVKIVETRDQGSAVGAVFGPPYAIVIW